MKNLKHLLSLFLIFLYSLSMAQNVAVSPYDEAQAKSISDLMTALKLADGDALLIYTSYVDAVIPLSQNIARWEALRRESETFFERASAARFNLMASLSETQKVERHLASALKLQSQEPVTRDLSEMVLAGEVIAAVQQARDNLAEYRRVAQDLRGYCSNAQNFSHYDVGELGLIYIYPTIDYGPLEELRKKLDAEKVNDDQYRKFATEYCVRVHASQDPVLTEFDAEAKLVQESLDQVPLSTVETKRKELYGSLERHAEEFGDYLIQTARERSRRLTEPMDREARELRLSMETNRRIDRNLLGVEQESCNDLDDILSRLRTDIALIEFHDLPNRDRLSHLRDQINRFSQTCFEKKRASQRASWNQSTKLFLTLITVGCGRCPSDKGGRDKAGRCDPKDPNCREVCDPRDPGCKNPGCLDLHDPKCTVPGGEICVKLGRDPVWHCTDGKSSKTGGGLSESGFSPKGDPNSRGESGKGSSFSSGGGPRGDGASFQSAGRSPSSPIFSVEGENHTKDIISTAFRATESRYAEVAPSGQTFVDLKARIAGLPISTASFQTTRATTFKVAGDLFSSPLFQNRQGNTSWTPSSNPVGIDSRELVGLGGKRDLRELWAKLGPLSQILRSDQRGGVTETAAMYDVYGQYFSAGGLLNTNALGERYSEVLGKLEHDLKTSPHSVQGQNVRHELNKGLVAYESASNEEGREEALGGMGLALAADEAYATGDKLSGDDLLRLAGTSLDLTLGFVPGVSVANDLTQIVWGMATGHDYAGNPMGTADYALRGVTAALGLFPGGPALAKAAGSVVKIGAAKITSAFVKGATAFRNSAPSRALIEQLAKFKSETLVELLSQLGGRKTAAVGKLGNRYAKQLSPLTGSYKEAFEGHIFHGTLEPGEIIFQAQREGQQNPGRFFGPIRPVNAEHAEELFNITKWENDAKQIKAYRVKEKVSVYAGAVSGKGKIPKASVGTEGHQIFIPEEIPLEDVLEELIP